MPFDASVWMPLFLQGGAIAVLCVWVFLEVKDRKERDKRIEALVSRSIDAMNDNTKVIDNLIAVQQSTKTIVSVLKDTILFAGMHPVIRRAMAEMEKDKEKDSSEDEDYA